MLKNINTIYLLFGVSVYAVFAFYIPFDNGIIYLLNFFQLLSFWSLLEYTRNRNEEFFHTRNLVSIVLLYTLFFCISLNLISHAYRGNFLVFSELDAVLYDYYGRRMASMTLAEGINEFLNYYSFDDLGMVMVTSSIYRFIDSNLALNVFYILLSILSARHLFKICKYFMTHKYAYLCSLTFSCSSFMVWFNSSGLKESIMIYLLIFLFQKYYAYRSVKNIFFLFQMTLAILAIGFFRPVISVFFIASVALSYLLENRNNIKGGVVMVGFLMGLVVLSSFIVTVLDRYTLGGDIVYLLAVREAQGMVIGGVTFTYAVNILSQFFGPLATFIPLNNIKLAFYAPGLLFRMLLSLPFWFGAYIVLKRLNSALLSMVFFSLIEMLSLLLILEGLELRKALLHFPFVFVVAFYFLDNIKKAGFLKREITTKRLLLVGSIVLCVLLVVWNIRLIS